ncbi:MAG: hypothetical protein ABIL09_16080 [Gemmatimonadota bacterium]
MSIPQDRCPECGGLVHKHRGSWCCHLCGLEIGPAALLALRQAARYRAALERIAEWPYDIMHDCVAEAKAEARRVLEG